MPGKQKKSVVMPPMTAFPSGSVQVANAGIQPGSMAPGAIEATTFAAGAIDAAAIADGAIDNATFAAAALVGQLVKSIQVVSGTIAAAGTTGTITFSAVNPARAFPVLLGQTCEDDNVQALARLTSWGATSANIARAVATAGVTTVSIAVVELF